MDDDSHNFKVTDSICKIMECNANLKHLNLEAVGLSETVICVIAHKVLS